MFRRSLSRRLRRFWITRGKAIIRRTGGIIFWFSGKVSMLQRVYGKGIPPCGSLKMKSKIISLPTRRGDRLQVVWVVCYNRDMAVMVAGDALHPCLPPCPGMRETCLGPDWCCWKA
jgi:hypothetical protein